MRSYEAARSTFSFIEIVAMLVMAAGVIAAFFGGQAVIGNGLLPALLSAMPGIAVFMLGSFVQVNAQTGRASVDCAECVQQSLKLSRDQFEISKQMLALAKGEKSASGYAAAASESNLQNISFETDAAAAAGEEPPAAKPLAIEEYGGVQIEKVADGYRIDSRIFANIESARNAVDQPEARDYLAIRRESSISLSTHPTRFGPICTRLRNVPAFSSLTMCCGEYKTSSFS